MPQRTTCRSGTAGVLLGNTIRVRAITHSLCCARAERIIFSKKSGDIQSSESKKLTHSVVTACSPRLRAAAAPGVSSESKSYSQWGFCCCIQVATTALESSVEALSTTMSCAGRSVCARMESSVARMQCARLNRGTTTATLGEEGASDMEKRKAVPMKKESWWH